LREPLVVTSAQTEEVNTVDRELRLQRTGTRILLERRLEHDRAVLEEARRLFPPAADAARPSFPFGKKKLALLYQHDEAEARRVMAGGRGGDGGGTAALAAAAAAGAAVDDPLPVGAAAL
jgi:hypothetical protein